MRGFVLFTNVATLGVTLSVGANDIDSRSGYVLPDNGRGFGLTRRFHIAPCLNLTHNQSMKDLSVSYFKAKISACLREVQAGETIVITEHQRPVAEVRPYDQSGSLIVRSEKPFSLAGSEPTTPSVRVWRALLDEEREEP